MNAPARTLTFISYYWPPSTQMAAHRAAALVRFLTDRGWSVQVITTGDVDDTSGPVWRVRDPLARVTTQAQSTGASGGGWKAALVRFGRALIPFDSSLLWNRRVAQLVGRNASAVLLTSAPPFATTFSGWLVKRRCPNARWVHELRDLVATNPIYAWGRVRRWLNFRLERRLLRGADAVGALSEEILKTYRQEYGLTCPGTVAYNGFDPAFADAVRQSPAAPSDTLRLLHVGSFYGTRTPEALLRGLRAADSDKFRMTFVGQTPDEMVTWIRELGLEKVVRVVPPVPHDELVGFYGDADVLVVITHADGASRYAIPGKLFEYIGTGRKILAITSDPLPKQIIEADALGWVCAHDPAAVAATLGQIARGIISEATAEKFAAGRQFAKIEKLLTAEG